MINLIDILNEAKEKGLSAFSTFSEQRKKGAEKIATNAKEKGGVSMLTYNHFVVKLPYYEKAKNGKLDLEKGKKEYNELLDKLVKATKGKTINITQTEFQKLVGKIEVLGELMIKSKEK